MVSIGRNWDVANFIFPYFFKSSQQSKPKRKNIYPADGFFGTSDYRKFVAILAMYHDQGLAPFKALAFDSGVNFTAGLSRIRTSPAHGTAYSIAGTNVASAKSFQEALYMAIDVYRNRENFEEINKDPLKVSEGAKNS